MLQALHLNLGECLQCPVGAQQETAKESVVSCPRNRWHRQCKASHARQVVPQCSVCICEIRRNKGYQHVAEWCSVLAHSIVQDMTQKSGNKCGTQTHVCYMSIITLIPANVTFIESTVVRDLLHTGSAICCKSTTLHLALAQQGTQVIYYAFKKRTFTVCHLQCHFFLQSGKE